MGQMSDILHELSEFKPTLLAMSKQGEMVSKLANIQPDTNFRAYTLYIGFASQMQNAIRFVNKCTFFLVLDLDNFVLPVEHDNTIVTFPKGTDTNMLFKVTENLLNQQVSLLEDSYYLFTTLLETSDLSDIADVASRLVDNPVIILDITFKVLAYSNLYQANDEQWNQNIARGYCSCEYIAGFNNIVGAQQSELSNKPFIVNCHTSPLRRCISNLYHGGQHIGFFITIEATSQFENLNMKLVSHISDAVATLVYMENILTQNIHNKAYDSVLVDCLNQTFGSRNVFYDRMEKAGFNLHSKYIIMIVDISKYNNYDYNSEHLRQYLNSILKNAWIICYKNDVVVLIDAHGAKKEIFAYFQEKSPYFEQNKIRAGFSDYFLDLFEMHKNYMQAKSALVISSYVDPDKIFSSYNDYKFYDLICQIKEPVNISNYVNNDVLLIKQYDEEYGTNYYETVRIYLKCDRRMSAAAAIFDIHKNTMAYRIGKVKELFNINFDDPMKRFQFMYSFLLEEIIDVKLLQS